VRGFSGEPLTIGEISQLLWAAQGITDPEGLRAAPSAGALYPLEIHVVANNVSDLAPGVYKYTVKKHELLKVTVGDERHALGRAAAKQDCVLNGEAVIVFSAVFDRTTQKYGRRGVPYVYMEVGHAVENVCLQAVALDLGTVVVGSFDDAAVRKIVQTPGDQQPLALMPIGRR
jgi:SagB-type dehydrogenase family enzyme